MSDYSEYIEKVKKYWPYVKKAFAWLKSKKEKKI